MKYSEELLWILDDPNGFPRTLEAQNKKIQICTDFVHSLGLKSDCVGWCKIDLSSPRTAEILNSISKFCKENGWLARGWYTRKYIDIESDWYELVPTYFKNNTPCDTVEAVNEEEKKTGTLVIRAFHELSPTPKWHRERIYAPERFRNFCIQNNLDGLDFCWVKDKGKYEAEQYFQIFGKHLIPQIATNYALDKTQNAKLIAAAGGWLPEISNIFYKLQSIDLQDCYLTSDMPACGIAYAYIPSTFSRAGRHTILLHKDIVQSLLQQKILPLSSFRPAPVFESLPEGYSLEKTQSLDCPNRQFMDKMLEEYKKLKNTPRPIRMVSEKDALKILRLSKKERKEDFQKALPKSERETLQNSDYNVLIPYYSVANGCFLSDEYELLSFAMAIEENEEFQERLSKEELLDAKPEGIVIGRCPDGDVIILLSNNSNVVRFSHEEPVTVEQWPTLPQFFVDAINE